jgi:hypothetical protein
MGGFVRGILGMVLVVGVLAAVFVFTIFGHTILNGPALNAAYAGVYKDDAGDSLDFREDNSVIANSHVICKYHIGAEHAQSLTSELIMTCGQDAPEMMILHGSSALDRGNAVGPPTIYKHVSDRLSPS